MADAVLILHGLFIAWVLVGALAVARWPHLLWLHLPALGWAAWIEFSGGICPLTPLENAWRLAAGQAGYSGSFIEHYLWPLIYPDGLTPGVQWLLGALVLGLNGALYGGLWWRRRARAARGA